VDNFRSEVHTFGTP